MHRPIIDHWRVPTDRMPGLCMHDNVMYACMAIVPDAHLLVLADVVNAGVYNAVECCVVCAKMHTFVCRRGGASIHIERSVLNEVELEHLLSPKKNLPVYKNLTTYIVPPEPVLSAIKPPMNRQAWLRFILTHLPILQWVWTYQLQYILSDVVSGLTVAFMHIPQGTGRHAIRPRYKNHFVLFNIHCYNMQDWPMLCWQTSIPCMAFMQLLSLLLYTQCLEPQGTFQLVAYPQVFFMT